jgi:Spy/CpxP family protein refolding chaperone
LKNTVAFIWTLLNLLTPSPAAAAEQGLNNHDKAQIMQKELNLTGSQLEEIQKLRAKMKPQMDALKAKECELKENLQQSLVSSSKGPDFQAELQKKFETYRAAHNAVRAQMFQLALQIRETLKPEQITKFNALQREPGKPEHNSCQGASKD